ncbi:hypothetical protein ACQP1V_28335 [Microtetraspora malaysiensis]|uniref:hypothetical protein n=1 Tax=Microtetraspora malaysiensis TaxID=161358 RepID=UPI003D8ADBEB
MLDHRNITTSSRQYSGEPGVWTREMNEFGWRSVIGRGEVPEARISVTARRTRNDWLARVLRSSPGAVR